MFSKKKIPGLITHLFLTKKPSLIFIPSHDLIHGFRDSVPVRKLRGCC